jgi:hypothetical protein
VYIIKHFSSENHSTVYSVKSESPSFQKLFFFVHNIGFKPEKVQISQRTNHVHFFSDKLMVALRIREDLVVVMQAPPTAMQLASSSSATAVVEQQFSNPALP